MLLFAVAISRLSNENSYRAKSKVLEIGLSPVCILHATLHSVHATVLNSFSQKMIEKLYRKHKDPVFIFRILNSSSSGDNERNQC